MSDLAADDDLPAFTAPYIVIDDFLPLELALSMRADIDRHFGEPDTHRPDTHQVWNYWYVPGTYTYLRTQPERLMGEDKVLTFTSALREFTAARLGLALLTPPTLSLYIDGCSQQFHNDATNGRFAFVYSLTNPVRQTIGGGTVLMTEADLYRRHLDTAMAMRGFCETIEPRFNRLLLFDDRLFHAVERVEGSMDPVEGRFVLHGHIRDQGPLLGGALPLEAIQPALQEALAGFVAQHGEESYDYHGPISVRFVIEPPGGVRSLRVLMDRVTHVADAHADGWPALRARYLAALGTVRYPQADGPTTVILPMAFAGPAGRPEG
jgi:hypothetical protein